MNNLINLSQLNIEIANFIPEITLFIGAISLLLIDIFLSKNSAKISCSVNSCNIQGSINNHCKIANFISKYSKKAIYILAIIFSLSASFFSFTNSHIDFNGNDESETTFQHHEISINAKEQLNIERSKESAIFSTMLYHDNFNAIFKAIIALILAIIIINSIYFIRNIQDIMAEFLALLLMASCGGMILISANNFLTFYLGLEMQGLSLYLLASLNKKNCNNEIDDYDNKMASEAGIKYFILGSVASAIILFGVSLIYGFSGSVNFDIAKSYSQIVNNAEYSNINIPIALLFGLILVFCGMFFKIAAAPFHLWSPDVYQGSTMIVTNFFATISKSIAIIATLNILTNFLTIYPQIKQIIIFIAVLSIIIGSLSAIKQQNIKRLFAYSSVVHIGFILLIMASIDDQLTNLVAIKSLILTYIVIYISLTLSSFLSISLLNIANKSNNDIIISDLSGLAKRNPFFSFNFAIILFSIAGIPPLAGFFSKFSALIIAMQAKLIFPVLVAIIFSLISAFYYLRIIKIMYFEDSSCNEATVKCNIISYLTIFLIVICNISFLLFFNKIIDFFDKISF